MSQKTTKPLHIGASPSSSSTAPFFAAASPSATTTTTTTSTTAPRKQHKRARAPSPVPAHSDDDDAGQGDDGGVDDDAGAGAVRPDEASRMIKFKKLFAAIGLRLFAGNDESSGVCTQAHALPELRRGILELVLPRFPDGLPVEFFELILEGEARRWWGAIGSKTAPAPATWVECFNRVERKYVRGPDLAHRAHDELLALTRAPSRDTVEKFMYNFSSCLDRVRASGHITLTDAAAISMCRMGMPLPFGATLAANPASYETFDEFAHTVETLRYQLSRQQASEGAPHLLALAPDAAWQPAPAPSHESTVLAIHPSRMPCTRCQRPGHSADRCMAPRPADSSSSSGPSGRYRDRRGNRGRGGSRGRQFFNNGDYNGNYGNNNFGRNNNYGGANHNGGANTQQIISAVATQLKALLNGGNNTNSSN